MSSKTSRLHTYAIIHGFSHGRGHSKKMRQLLHRHGYAEAANTPSADIIIAHSAGCYQLPDDAQARLVLLVGVPMNPSNIRDTFKIAQRQDVSAFRNTGQLRERHAMSRRSILQLFRRSRHHYKLVQTVKVQRHTLPISNAQQTTVISSHFDPWPEPLKELVRTTPQAYSFVSVPGGHNHIWQDPEVYIEIINAYATQLLA